VISLVPSPGYEVVTYRRQNTDDTTQGKVKGQLTLLPICISLSRMTAWNC